jgi:uncharacterized membrane protein YgcG
MNKIKQCPNCGVVNRDNDVRYKYCNSMLIDFNEAAKQEHKMNTMRNKRQEIETAERERRRKEDDDHRRRDDDDDNMLKTIGTAIGVGLGTDFGGGFGTSDGGFSGGGGDFGGGGSSGDW